MAFWSGEKKEAPPAARRDGPESLSKVKNIIVVGSGKGGVGKSTVATNLAVALTVLGSKVGLMDSDIYGPSQPGMLGARKKKAEMAGENLLAPVDRHGVKFISMGLLMDDEGPVVWRAPMAMKIIHQFIGNVAWGELDYLLIDLPPGTGDVQLTIAQQTFLTGAVIVTTPQDVALGIAKKGLKMFQQVNVPILGVAENMSGFFCGKCGEKNSIFKEGGGVLLAKEHQVPFLGAVPLDPEVVKSGDTGVPVLAATKETPAAKAFLEMAKELVRQVDLARQAAGRLEPARLEAGPAGELFIHWTDGHVGLHTPHHLRLQCACAACVDENTGVRTLDPKRVSLDVKLASVEPVGRYGLAAVFSDGHNTGIYTFERLREICECAECLAKKNKTPEPFAV
ncbi:MAG: P-loop NTPase [Elusimicrobia bacterium]|nr:P-loop NTPase [Elusimicrobiota bacterium]